MIEIRSIPGFLVVILVLGTGLAIQPPATNAQSNKENKENSRERKDDDHDADEKLSHEDAKQAKISLAEARAIALRRIDGKVIEEDLEKENGRLQYAFDIRTADGKVFDVEIDAITGEVLQATEDDGEDGDNDQSRLRRAKNSVYRAANTVKNVTVRVVGKLF